MNKRQRYRQSLAGKASRKRFKLKRKEKWSKIIGDIKESNPCADCGNFYPAVCMDFDHVRGVKSDQISQMVKGRVSVTAILAEVKKCELVCSNCHRIRTRDRRSENSKDFRDSFFISECPAA